jgi:hypothetical protein
VIKALSSLIPIAVVVALFVSNRNLGWWWVLIVAALMASSAVDYVRKQRRRATEAGVEKKFTINLPRTKRNPSDKAATQVNDSATLGERIGLGD